MLQIIMVELIRDGTYTTGDERWSRTTYEHASQLFLDQTSVEGYGAPSGIGHNKNYAYGTPYFTGDYTTADA